METTENQQSAENTKQKNQKTSAETTAESTKQVPETSTKSKISMPVFRYRGYDLPLQKMVEEDYCVTCNEDVEKVRDFFPEVDQANFVLAIVNELRATQRELRHVDSLILAGLQVLADRDSNVSLKEFLTDLGLVVRDAHGNEFNPNKQL